jgi:hypothetical protein
LQNRFITGQKQHNGDDIMSVYHDLMRALRARIQREQSMLDTVLQAFVVVMDLMCLVTKSNEVRFTK